MLSPKLIQDGLVTLMRDIPDLVLLVSGDPDRIYAHDRTYPGGQGLLEALDGMEPPAIMVSWSQTVSDFIGGGWKHEFSIILMPDGDLFALQSALLSGIVTSTGMTLINSEPISDVEPGEYIARIAERDYGDFILEYPEINVSFTQKWPS